MSKYDEYIKFLRECEAKWGDLIHCIPEYVRTKLNDDEYVEWYADLKEMQKRYSEYVEEYSSTHYFPGCYGDPLMDCN